MVPPVILLVEAATGRVRDGIVLAAGSMALFLFSLARIAATANSHRRSLIFRERHDTLTGLANRSNLVDRVAGAVAARRDGQVGLLLLDLDHFRLVNDSEGQSVGDEVLVAIARRLVRHLAPHDVLARFGGDEFAILVGALPPGRDIPALCERIVAATKEPVSVAGRSVAVSACVGLAIVDGSSTDAEGEARDLLRHAGLALQAAKSAGPGEWCRYESERHEQIVERMRLREALSRP
jgi:diguanylate cyclase (GGDEF)-like protein